VADLTPEAVTWIREQARRMAPYRMAAILGTHESVVAAVLSGDYRPAAVSARTTARKGTRRPA